MSAIFLPRRWRHQPQGAVEVDYRNPLAEHLELFYLPSLGAQPIGRTTQFDLQANRYVYDIKPEGVVRDCMVPNYGINFSSAVAKSTLAGGTLMVGCGAALISDGYGLGACRAGTSGARFYLRRNSLGRAGFGYNSTANIASADEPWGIYEYGVISGSWGASGAEAYFNGKRFYSTATKPAERYTRGQLFNLPTLSNDDALPGNPQYSPTGFITWAAFFTDWLPPEAHAALAENPYQILTAPPRRIIFDLGASPAPVLSLAGVTDIGTTSARPKVTVTYV